MAVTDMRQGAILGATGQETDAVPYSFLSAGTGDGDAQIVSVGPVNVYVFTVSNTNAAVRYCKIYNKATAATSSDTPILRFTVPIGGIPVGWALPVGLSFSLGFSFRLVTGVADNDSTEVAANELIVNALYAT